MPFNVNVQQIYSLAFASNHLEHLLPLFTRVESWSEILRRNARVVCGIEDGFIIGMCTDDRGEMVGSGPGMLLDQFSSGWMAQLFWQYYLYTGDLGFLRERAYPFLCKVMRVYEEMLEETQGRFSLPLGISAEFGNDISPRILGRNPSSQLACIHMLLDALLESARLLNIPPRPIWKSMRENLPPFTLIGRPGDERIAIWEGQDLDFCHRHHSHLSCIYPFDTLGELTPEIQGIVDNSIDHWISKGMGKWSEWSMPIAAIIQCRMGFKESPWQILQMWRKLFVNEGLATVYAARFPGLTTHRKDLQKSSLETHEIMQLDGTMGAVTAFYEMLVHTRNGITHIFPGVPDEMKDIAFSNIRVPGGFLISAERRNSKLQSVHIKSTIAGALTLDIGGCPAMTLIEKKKPKRRVALPVRLVMKPNEKFLFRPV